MMSSIRAGFRRKERTMIEITIGSLICLIVAAICATVAAIITLLGRITASQGGATGCFTLGAGILVVLAIALLFVGL